MVYWCVASSKGLFDSGLVVVVILSVKGGIDQGDFKFSQSASFGEQIFRYCDHVGLNLVALCEHVSLE